MKGNFSPFYITAFSVTNLTAKYVFFRRSESHTNSAKADSRPAETKKLQNPAVQNCTMQRVKTGTEIHQNTVTGLQGSLARNSLHHAGTS